MTDTLRIATILLALLMVATLPAAIGMHGRPRRTWLLLASLVLVWLSCAFAVGAHLGGGPVRWYRTPLVFVASLLGLCYTLLSLRAEAKRRACRAMQEARERSTLRGDTRPVGGSHGN